MAGRVGWDRTGRPLNSQRFATRKPPIGMQLACCQQTNCGFFRSNCHRLLRRQFSTYIHNNEIPCRGRGVQTHNLKLVGTLLSSWRRGQNACLSGRRPRGLQSRRSCQSPQTSLATCTEGAFTSSCGDFMGSGPHATDWLAPLRSQAMLGS